MHAFTLAFIVLGCVTVVVNAQYLAAWLLGGTLVAIGVLLRPRLGRLPADAEVLARSSAEELYGAATRIAEAVGVKPPATVAIRDLGVGADYDKVGLRRTPVLVIGLPLWLALTPRQRVALLATAYSAAESQEGLIVAGAQSTLSEWRHALLGAEPLKRREEARAQIDAASLGVMHAPDTTYEMAGFIGRVFGRVLGGPVLLAELALNKLVRAGDDRVMERRRALAERAAPARELAELAELMASGSYMAPMQAAALRGENVAAIRESALARSRLSDDGVLTSVPGSRLLGSRESELIDEELLKHYRRAIRGFGLIT